MRRKRGGKGGPKFVMLSEWMMNTPAWKSLSPVERSLYVEVKRRYDGQNNGTIGFGVREAAAALNVSKTTAARAFSVLEDRGFFVLAKASGFNVKNRVATEWLITEEKDDRTGALATKAFRLWAPDTAAAVCDQSAGKSANLRGSIEHSAIAVSSENTAIAVIPAPMRKKHGPSSGTHGPSHGTVDPKPA